MGFVLQFPKQGVVPADELAEIAFRLVDDA
jgi:hypothetical protein